MVKTQSMKEGEYPPLNSKEMPFMSIIPKDRSEFLSIQSPPLSPKHDPKLSYIDIKICKL